MKFKTTAIAMAVAGTVAAPVAVQAGADEIYASARVGVQNVNTDGVSDPEIRSFTSRFGARGETDLGNGLTAFGRYEWNVDFNDRDGDLSGDGSISIRHRYVGLKGDFGSIRIGEAHHTFFTFVVAPFDQPWWHSGGAMVAYVGRTDNGITYAGNAGNFAFGVTAYMVRDEEEDPIDVVEVAASYTFGNDMVLAVGGIATKADEDDGTGTLIADTRRSDDSVFGVTLSGIMLGDFGMVFNAQSQGDDTSFGHHISYGNLYFHTELEFIDEDTWGNPTGDDLDRKSFTLGYTQGLGRKTTMWYEVNYTDQDTDYWPDTGPDSTTVMAVLKYDII